MDVALLKSERPKGLEMPDTVQTSIGEHDDVTFDGDVVVTPSGEEPFELLFARTVRPPRLLHYAKGWGAYMGSSAAANYTMWLLMLSLPQMSFDIGFIKYEFVAFYPLYIMLMLSVIIQEKLARERLFYHLLEMGLLIRWSERRWYASVFLWVFSATSVSLICMVVFGERYLGFATYVQYVVVLSSQSLTLLLLYFKLYWSEETYIPLAKLIGRTDNDRSAAIDFLNRLTPIDESRVRQVLRDLTRPLEFWVQRSYMCLFCRLFGMGTYEARREVAHNAVQPERFRQILLTGHHDVAHMPTVLQQGCYVGNFVEWILKHQYASRFYTTGRQVFTGKASRKHLYYGWLQFVQGNAALYVVLAVEFYAIYKSQYAGIAPVRTL